MEVFFPLFRLMEEGVDVTVAAPAVGEIHGENGYGLVANTRIADVQPDEYDLLIIPGGSPDGAPATVRNVPEALTITRRFFEQSKPVAAICHGPYTLVSADVVQGRCLTSYWHDGVPEEIEAAGGEWVDEAVVVDGNLVTSRWPMDLPYFMQKIMALLEE
jgi:protease I